MKEIFLAAGFALLLVAQSACVSYAADTEQIVVGVREDARPFAWFDKGNQRFEGFLVEVCRYAIENMGLTAKEIPVTAQNRFYFLEKPVDQGGVHMLCDTTSITLSRARLRLFSPIVFLSGISYAVSPAAEKKQIENFTASQKNASGAQATDNCSEKNTERVPVKNSMQPLMHVGVLGGTTAFETVRRDETLSLFRLEKNESVCVNSALHNYEAGIQELCSGKIAYFFGDRDLIAYHLNEYKKTEKGKNCDAVLSRKFFSYEPYALVVRDSRVDIFKKLQAALFELFRDEKTLNSIIKNSFGDQKPSGLLSALFRINAIGKL